MLDIDVKINHQKGDWRMFWEWHEQVEIMYVLSGTGKCYVGENIYTFQEGDLFIVGPHKLHKTELIPNHDFKVLIVIFNMNLQKNFPEYEKVDVLQFLKLNYADYPSQLLLEETERDKLESIFHNMLTEYTRKEGYSLGYLISYLHILLIDINRLYNKHVTSMRNEEINEIRLPKVIVEVIGYINQHFKEDLHLSKIAETFGLNSSYLSRQFKQSTGLTVTEFLTARRIEFAKSLLAKTDKTITEVSFDVGYNNTPYFTSVFKESVGMTPKQFRNGTKVPRPSF